MLFNADFNVQKPKHDSRLWAVLNLIKRFTRFELTCTEFINELIETDTNFSKLQAYNIVIKSTRDVICISENITFVYQLSKMIFDYVGTRVVVNLCCT